MCAASLFGLGALPSAAAARSRSGLGCLQGSWISDGIQSAAASGLSGIRLTITPHGRWAAADANYNWTKPLRFTGSPFIVYIRGASFGRFRYAGHGHYTYAPGRTTEASSVFVGSAKVAGPSPVSKNSVARYTGLRCTAARLTDRMVVPTKRGPVTVRSSFHRAS